MAPWIEELAKLEGPGELDAYFAAHPELQRREEIEQLTAEVTRWARIELPKAERLSVAASRMAEILDDNYARALSLKVRGHLRYLVGSYDEALRHYRDCQATFLAAGAKIEAAVNLATSMWVLALLGRYDEAWVDSREARRTLEPHGDPILLARITSKEAQIFHRQDRHHDALEHTRSALPLFRKSGEPQDVAVSLHNIAVSSIVINDFDGALDAYRELSAHCSEHDIPGIAAQADYNIAYLYFFRGEYTRAIEIYQKTRTVCEEVGDRYHLALCDLDQAEIYLELNLYEEAARLAKLAFDSFEERGNGYEAAKALSFLAIAANHAGEHDQALADFASARERFVAEDNSAWAATTDFYRGLIHYEQMRPKEARELCGAAREFYDGVPWPSRVALCDLLLAQVDLQQGLVEEAHRRCVAALESLEPLDLPLLSLKALVVLGRAEEMLEKDDSALAAYRRAHQLLENLRTHLGSEESKIAFLGDKLEVYESLVHLTLTSRPSEAGLRQVFGYIEQAKSRILADLLASGASYLLTSSSDHPELTDKLRGLREELSLHHNELTQLYNLRATGSGQPAAAQEGSRPPPGEDLTARLESVEQRSRDCERRLLETMRELRSLDPDFAALHTAETIDFDHIRDSIPSGAQLLEYFESRGAIYACILDRDRFDIRPVARISTLRSTLELFESQMSKYQLGDAYLKVMGKQTLDTTLGCLEELHKALVEPIAPLLDAEHLIVVPHGILHQVPFHALRDGGEFLLDRYRFSYAPSASLYSALQKSTRNSHEKALVLGVPDERAPEIANEVEVVAQNLPSAQVFVGDEATAERLRQLGAESRIVHIATHGFFRQDNPMFSAIQLGDSRLTLMDLYDLRLDTELVVLSGCSTGLNKVESGDELMGLTRGLLYAGARSLMVSLWDVHDKSTAGFMKAFYGYLATEPDRAKALARAMRDLRAEYESPYYWAPFVLIGKSSESDRN